MKTLLTLPMRLLTFVVMAIAIVFAFLQGKEKHYGMRLGYKNDAVSTQGFKLEVALPPVAPATDPTYVEVGGITDIPDPTGESSDLDVTNLKSTSKEYINGLRDSQSVNITGQALANDAGQKILKDNAGAEQPLFFRNTYSDGQILEYQATCKKYGITGGVDAVQMFTCSIRGSGTGEWSGTGNTP